MQSTHDSVLLVDEDPHLLRMLRDRLHFEGVSVATADCCQAAMRCVHAQPPDLIVIDYHTPAPLEQAFLRSLADSENTSSIPVLVLVTHATSFSMTELPNVVNVLPKSAPAWRIAKAIRSIVHRHRLRHRPIPAAQVMLAENDEAFSEQLSEILQESGHRVEVARTGMDLLDRVQTTQSDVIVLKENLPRMSGTCLASLVAAMPSTRALPVLIYGGTQQGVTEQQEWKPGDTFRRLIACTQPSDVARAIDDMLSAVGTRNSTGVFRAVVPPPNLQPA